MCGISKSYVRFFPVAVWATFLMCNVCPLNAQEKNSSGRLQVEVNVVSTVQANSVFFVNSIVSSAPDGAGQAGSSSVFGSSRIVKRMREQNAGLSSRENRMELSNTIDSPKQPPAVIATITVIEE
ncbi:MAG: hypothetical protein JOZ10_19395 [Acidobacteria bacterium]|nr:hypothetical protein [Acidobacteriota bacterium]MBV9145438.1 hypothetical protein [Acidobacteriota bacterium]MBV9436267.1 hypothetical protein [Acidobacteriota bacterium]